MAFVKTSIAGSQPEDPFFIPGDRDEDFVICKSPDKLKSLLSALKKDKQLHYISDGDWSLHDLIMELLKEYKPAELYLTTYAIRELAIRQLVMAMERKELLSVHMIADYRAKVRTPEVYQLAHMNMNKICLHSIHAKVTVIRSAVGCVTILGSCNLTSNPRIEAGVISQNVDIANFHINWINKIMDNAEIFE
jgi:hypothetical protein